MRGAANSFDYRLKLMLLLLGLLIIIIVDTSPTAAKPFKV